MCYFCDKLNDEQSCNYDYFTGKYKLDFLEKLSEILPNLKIKAEQQHVQELFKNNELNKKNQELNKKNEEIKKQLILNIETYGMECIECKNKNLVKYMYQDKNLNFTCKNHIS